MALKLVMIFLGVYACFITFLIFRDHKNGPHYKKMNLFSWLSCQERDQIDMPDKEEFIMDKIKH